MISIRTFLEECKKLEREALEAPWAVFQWEDGTQKENGMFNVACDSAEIVIVKDIPHNDAAFIASSRTAVPLLISMLETAVTALEYYQNEDNYGRWVQEDDGPGGESAACSDIDDGRRAREALSALETLSKEKP